MKIVGIDGMTGSQLQQELERGGRFVVFQYCISILVLTFRRSSNVYFLPGGASAVGKAAPFTLISLLLGWWGIPWGPIWTVGSIVTNLRGGKNVTADVVRALSTAT